MTINTNEPIKKSINKKVANFKRFCVHVKEIKSHFLWFQKHESVFPIVSLLAWQILGIVWITNREKIFLFS